MNGSKAAARNACRRAVLGYPPSSESHAHLLFKVVSVNGKPPTEELEEIAGRSRLAMGKDCHVDFEFCEELPALPSGKFRYTISEVAA